MRYRMALFLAAAALIGGCVGEPTSSYATEPATAYDQPPARDEPPAATMAEQASPTPQEAEPRTIAIDGPSGGPTMVRSPVFMNGTTPTRVCYSGPLQGAVTGRRCQDFEASQGTTMALDMPARPAFLNGTLTWDSPTPAADRLYTYLLVHEAGHYVYIESRTETFGGTSPLQVSFDLSQYEGQKLGLGVANMACPGTAACPTGYVVTYGLAQEFAFNGELTGWE